jgi:putative ABC transport system permease protein
VALGSRSSGIAALMLRQGLGWMAAGLAGGALGAMLVVRLLRSLIDGVPRFDPLALGLGVGIMIGCATIALLIPIRRATRVDPVIALRAE